MGIQLWLIYGMIGATLMGVGVYLVYGRLTERRTAKVAQPLEQFQIRYEQQNNPIPWPVFLRDAAIWAAGMTVFGYLATGNPVVAIMFAVLGVVIVWTGLANDRDREQMRYADQLEEAIGYIQNAFRAKSSIDLAVRMPAEYLMPGPVKDDFVQILKAREAGFTRSKGFEDIAEKRRSLFLDGFLETLRAADQESGDVNRILDKQAITIRDQVEVFKTHLVRCKAVRRNLLWGVFGPWGVIGVARSLTSLTSSLSGGISEASISSFYASPLGLAVGIGLAGWTIYRYFLASQTMRSGIVLERLNSDVT